MTVGEYELISILFLTAVISLVCLALPGYAIYRRFNPESDWHLRGNLSTSVISPGDLVLVGIYLLGFILTWRALPERTVRLEEEVHSTGAIFIAQFEMIVLAALVPAALFMRINLAEFFGLRWTGWRAIFWIIPVFVVSMILCNLLLFSMGWHELVQTRLGGGIQDPIKILRESKDPIMLVAMVIAAVVVAPITEEVIFRGYLYPVIKRFTEGWFAMAFTGLLFGVIHFNLLSLPVLTLMGIVLAYLYEKTGSIWVPIACHAAFNGLMVGLMILQKLLPVP